MLKYIIFTSVILACVQKATNQFFRNGLDFDNIGGSIMNMINNNLAQAGIPSNDDFTGGFLNPAQNFGKNLHNQIMQQTNIFQDNMNRFNNKLQAELHEMQLKLSAPQIKYSMLKGKGGSSLVEYGNNNVVIVINDDYYKCSGLIVLPNRVNRRSYITCNGNFIPVNRIDPCIPGIAKTQINDVVCIGDHVNVFAVNNNVVCRNGVSYDRQQLKYMCGPRFGMNNYARVKYYPAIENVNHIPIPNNNKYVTCLNSDTSYCEFFTNDNGLIF